MGLKSYKSVRSKQPNYLTNTKEKHKMKKTIQDLEQVKIKLLKQVFNTCDNFEGQPNINFNGAYADDDMSFNYYVKTDGEGKVDYEFVFLNELNDVTDAYKPSLIKEVD